jgi:peptidoglycan/LPS O-acetylase OafA/YrhL
MSFSQPKPGRILELDGLRGLAVIVVVLAHYLAEVPHGFFPFSLGWLGVDVFFALSGFLIAGILIDNRDAKNYFSTFYIRRSCRIFPIYFLFIPPLVLLIHAMRDSGFHWLAQPLPMVGYLTYTQNIFMAVCNHDGGLSLIPTWTLAVEEQFYMLLPLIVLWVPRRWWLATLLFLIATAPILRSTLLFTLGSDHISANCLLPCRWDTLFWGAIAAIVWRNERLKSIVLHNNGKWLKAILVMVIWFVPLMLYAKKITDLPLRMSFGLTLIGLGSASYILLIVSKNVSSKFLLNGFLRFFGSISYGLYLVHQPVLVMLHGLVLGTSPEIETMPQILLTLVGIPISVGIAWASFTYFERRIVSFGHRFKYDADPVGR